jgi:uncharacterized protein (DUF433 family)
MKTSRWRERIWCDPKRMAGEPCVKGTRITVSLIVSSMAEMSLEELLKEYPRLTREDVQAALCFAAQASRNTLVA